VAVIVILRGIAAPAKGIGRLFRGQPQIRRTAQPLFITSVDCSVGRVRPGSVWTIDLNQVPQQIRPMSKNGLVSRRAFASGALSLAALALGARGADASDGFGSQVEWRQSYDSATRMRVPRSNFPMLSQDSAMATEAAIQRYREIAAAGGWGTLEGGQRLRLGARGPAVVALRRRLSVSGDLDASAGNTDVFDSFVDAAVRRFQARHGLSRTGLVGAQTVAALNVPAEVRVRQLETNLVRLRSFSGDLGRRYVIVNIPAATVETVENGQVYTRHAAGVGKADRQSPVMNAKIVEINFNPFWTVPASIIRKDLIPKMQKEPTYLTENKIRIYNQQGQELRPEQVNWFSDEATRYMFRQDPGGEFNSLGFVRINIPNPHGVYMHDTPAKGIFGDDFRFVSSGCVRVQNVRDYIAFILRDTPGWDRDAIDRAIDSGERVNVRLSQDVPVYWVYLTSWATSDGLIHFRDDIYSRDGIGGLPIVSAQAE
jgi:murein L,D-transpeptidase YcbB/YkuD